MKTLFIHDHKFRKINDRFYSPGGLSNEILSRYTQIFGGITVIGRIICEKEPLNTYSEITNDEINIEDNKDLYKRIEEADYIIIRLPSINGFKAVKICKNFKKDYLVEVVGCVKDAYLNYGTKGKICAYPAYYIMKTCVKEAKYAVYVTKDFLETRYPCKGKVIAISDVELKSKSESKEYRLQKDKITFGTLAAVDVEYKGQEFFIKAINDIEKELGIKVEYQLVGAGNTQRLLNIAKKYKAEDKVVFKGTIPHEDVFEWLDSLDFYIQPSLLEGLSRALIEAMSRGLVCYASDCGGNPELIDGKFLFSIKRKRNISKNIASVIVNNNSQNNINYESKRNFSYANSEYNAEHLDRIRKDFYHDFKKYIESNKD